MIGTREGLVALARECWAASEAFAAIEDEARPPVAATEWRTLYVAENIGTSAIEARNLAETAIHLMEMASAIARATEGDDHDG